MKHQNIFIIANWKMNPGTVHEAEQLFREVAKGVESIQSIDTVICPPCIYISKIQNVEHKVQLGAQDCSFFGSTGAYTGEISADMLKNAGCSYVILGHSERKNYTNETYEVIRKKVQTALRAGLIPVVCIGEKRQGENSQELETQLQEILQGITQEDMKKLILAYEPEWAISSNANAQPAAPQDCTRSIEHMREGIAKLFGKDAAQVVPIVYGGSTNSGNIADFLAAGAQGALVGSASLNANEFIRLVNNARA